MLPFLKPRKQGSVVAVVTKPDGSNESMGPVDEHDPAFMSAADDLISAIHSKDSKAVADALKAAFTICEAYPHKEE